MLASISKNSLFQYILLNCLSSSFIHRWWVGMGNFAVIKAFTRSLLPHHRFLLLLPSSTSFVYCLSSQTQFYRVPMSPYQQYQFRIQSTVIRLVTCRYQLTLLDCPFYHRNLSNATLLFQLFNYLFILRVARSSTLDVWLQFYKSLRCD